MAARGLAGAGRSRSRHGRHRRRTSAVASPRHPGRIRLAPIGREADGPVARTMWFVATSALDPLPRRRASEAKTMRRDRAGQSGCACLAGPACRPVLRRRARHDDDRSVGDAKNAARHAAERRAEPAQAPGSDSDVVGVAECLHLGERLGDRTVDQLGFDGHVGKRQGGSCSRILAARSRRTSTARA